MNNSQVLDLMIQRMGNRKNFSRDTLLLEMNSKIQELEVGSFLPWFLEGMWEEAGVDVPSLSLPEDFLQEVEDGKLELVSEVGKFIYPKKRPFEKVQEVWQVYPEGGEPRIYAIWGGQLHLAPRPVAPYVLSLPYFKQTPEVADGEEEVTSWLKHALNFITYATLVDVSSNNLRDTEAANRFSSLAGKAYSTLYRHNEARQHTNADYNIGEE
jgi:hypothetical protein